MGCAQYNRLSTEHAVLSKRLSQIVGEKNLFYNDKILLEAEITQLKKTAYEAVQESETIKAKFDEHRSTEVPEVFENAHRETGLVEDWLEMDWRDGDKLLDAMAGICPTALPEIHSLKAQSALLRPNQSPLHDFLTYFTRRFDFFTSVWRDALAAQEQVDVSVKHLKEDIVAGILAVESFIGKRSDVDNELHAEYRRVAALPHGKFLVEQRKVVQRLNALKAEMMGKRLDEKDTEKQRVVHLFQHEIAKIHEKNQAEQARSKAELLQECEQRVKSVFEAQKESINFKEEQCKSRIFMLIEDLRSNAGRIEGVYSEKCNLLNREITHKNTEIQLLKETLTDKKGIHSVPNYGEFQQMQKDNESLNIELINTAKTHTGEIEQLKVKFAQQEFELISDANLKFELLQHEFYNAEKSHKEEIDKMQSKYTEQMSKIQQEKLTDLQEMQKLSAELRDEFTSKIESQKAHFEVRINSERAKLTADLQAEKLENEILTQEMKLKDISNREMTETIAQLRNGEATQQQLITALQAKIELIDIESENRIKGIAQRYFPKFRSKENEEMTETEKNRTIAKLKAITDTLQPTNIDHFPGKKPPIDHPQTRFDTSINEFEVGLKLLKIQLSQISTEKSDAENQVLKLRSQISEKNTRLVELESALESSKRQIQRSKKDFPTAETPPKTSLGGSREAPSPNLSNSESPVPVDPFSQGDGHIVTPATLFGPLGSPYANRVYRLLLACGADYPKKPPKVKFVTKVNMRGVDAKTGVVDGKVKGIAGWNEFSTIETLLLGLRKEMTSLSNRKLPQPEEGAEFN